MTTLAEPPVATPPRALRTGDVLVVTALVLAELVLAWFTYDIGRSMQARLGLSRPVVWLYVMLPFLPLAVVVAVRAIRPSRALPACLAALGAGAALIVQEELVRWIFLHHPGARPFVVELVTYASWIGATTLATLAWGLSRRRGRGWPLGLLVAAGGAWLTVWTNWPAQLSRAGSEVVIVGGDMNPLRRMELLHSVAFLLPLIAGCIACWMIELEQRHRAAASQA